MYSLKSEDHYLNMIDWSMECTLWLEYFQNRFQENEWVFSIRNAMSLSESSQEFPRWSTPDRKEMLNSFASLFPKLVRTLKLDNQDLWLPFAASLECEKEISNSVKSQITSFQKLLVIKTFRPDRLGSAMNTFFCDALGKKTIAPSPLSSNLCMKMTPTVSLQFCL